jgi:hypothetical protein
VAQRGTVSRRAPQVECNAWAQANGHHASVDGLVVCLINNLLLQGAAMAQDISNGKQEQRVLQGGKIEGTARSLSAHVH